MLFNNDKVYIVAELNSSHRGNVELAKQMIDAAKKCGCDAVKFQSWSAESLYCKNYYDNNPIAKRMVKGFSLSPDKLKELSEYCGEVGIDFSSTPYSKEEVDFLVDQCNAKFIKIASMDINNIPFLIHIAKKNMPIVLSTGMATPKEIKKAVKTLSEYRNSEICILHCVSLYPVDANQVNLKNVEWLKKEFADCYVGYSDHTIGSEVAGAAIALGAVLVEKHFTLNNSVIGWDNQMATEPEDMKKLVDTCIRVKSAMGTYERVVSLDEENQKIKMRRSLVAARDLKCGSILQEEDIDAKRPGDGISVSEFYNIIGKELLCDLNKDEMIKKDIIK